MRARDGLEKRSEVSLIDFGNRGTGVSDLAEALGETVLDAVVEEAPTFWIGSEGEELFGERRPRLASSLASSSLCSCRWARFERSLRHGSRITQK